MFFIRVMVRDDSEQLVKYWEKWVKQYPIASIEDGMAEDDWDGWNMLTKTIGKKMPVSRR